jgi:hypothetical protein
MFLQEEIYLYVRSGLLKGQKIQPKLCKAMVNYVQNEYVE